MRTVSRSSKLGAIAGAALFAIALLAAGALAVTSPDQTRESYTAAVEPICKQNTKANEQILKGAEQKVKAGKLKVAAGQFTQAGVAFGKGIRQLKAVPQPAADATKLAKWFDRLEDEKTLLSEIGKALKQGKKSRAYTLSVRLKHNGNLANNAALGFDFNYCLIGDSSEFS